MAIELIDKIKQKNGGTFKLMDAEDIAFGEHSLTEEIDSVKTQLSDIKTNKMDKGGEITVSQINKNKGKLDQTYMSDEFLQQITGNTPVNSIPANNSITQEKLVNRAVSSSKAYRQIQNTLIYTSKDGLDFVFDNNNRVLRITCPYAYACVGSEYLKINNGNPMTFEVPYPNTIDGVSTLWFNLSSENFVIYNWSDYNTELRENADIILLGTLSIPNKEVYINGNYTVNGTYFNGKLKGEDLSTEIIDNKHLKNRVKNVYLYGNGTYDFSFVSNTLQITFPPYPYIVSGGQYWSINTEDAVNGVLTLTNPSAWDGIGYLCFDISSKKLFLVNFRTANADIINNDNAYIVGVISPAYGSPGFKGSITVNCPSYTVNKGEKDDTPIVFFRSNIIQDRNTLKVPPFYVKSRYSVSGKTITPQMCGLSGDYFEFEVPSGFDAMMLTLSYEKLLKITSDSTENESPFIHTTKATYPPYHKFDVLIASSIHGVVTTQYPFERVSDISIAEWGTVVGTDFPNFDFVNKKVVFSGFVLHNGTYYTPANLTLKHDLTLDGIHYIYFNKSTKLFEGYHYQEFSAIVKSSNLIQIATLYGGNLKTSTIQIIGNYKVNGVLQGGATNEVPSNSDIYSETNNRLILPDKMFFIDEDYLPIYKSSVVPVSSDTMKMSVQYISENDPVFNYFYEDYHLESSKIPSTFKIGVRQNKDNTLYFKDIQKVSTNPKNVANKTPKIMHLGDSITNRNIAYRNEIILKKYGITPTFVGTMNNGNSKRGEGREGWRYSNFVGQHNIYMNNGKPIHPQSSGATSDLEKNPFLKLATDEDKRNYPNWCFRNTGSAKELSYAEDVDKTGDFYIFDFAWYMENHSVDTPDIITIALSTNDINTLSWWEDSCSLGLDIMYRQIRKALPNVKIGIIPSPSWGFTHANWSAKVVKWIELCMQQVNEYNDNKLFVVPVWCHINKEWTFPQNSGENLSDTNTSKKTTLSDAIHFSSLGEQQYGKVMASFCINML